MRFSLVLPLALLGLTSTVAAAPPQPPRDNNADSSPALVKREDTKYFHEPCCGEELGHYDIRYFKEAVGYDDHRVVLRNLIRSYLTVTKKLKVETWLAHGTLLGWWWNGKIMPWDYDLDVQVSTATLYWMGQNLNRTEHDYDWTDGDGNAQKERYLLDVNPHGTDKDRGDGQNIIDARWINMANGAFIDITGLAERDPANSPGVWSCKNYHRYHTTDLFPMRETEFEGVPATIPYSFERILSDEYGSKSLVTTEWLGHKWEPEQKEWIKVPESDNQKTQQ
ncbi:Protein MNN4 [Colletotrichum tanaceti]|uniref:Protein MNN4 n=1 Tax=Colletotrichum tanaceti TaxID=1306861 RepID=A0A4U6XT63_9PEZI|nr:Protein MNN4 [Colletotrichum tanaceti]TKW59051.1 Protein MNN4 [Colletotrichum tanaceti]